jgi:hypothetical protein
MQRYMCDLFWNNTEGYGFSETYPIQASDPATCQTILAPIFAARVATLTPDNYLAGSRISDTDVKGDFWPTQLAKDTPGTFGSSDHTFQIPEAALAWKGQAPPFKQGTRWLHAIPNSQMVNGVYTPLTAWTTAVTAFLNLLIAGQVCIATRLKTAVVPPFYFYLPIINGTPLRLAKRNVGRPFGLPVGRRLVA